MTRYDFRTYPQLGYDPEELVIAGGLVIMRADYEREKHIYGELIDDARLACHTHYRGHTIGEWCDAQRKNVYADEGK